ncbi:MAG: cytochrome P450 [Caldilineaceae bacterium]
MLNGRQAAEDCTIGEYEIEQGQTVFISPYVMHRLAHHFPNPDEFQPERFTPAMEEALPRYAYMPFGGGPRVCIGNSFAMMEAQLVLATVAQRYELQLALSARVATQPMITLTAKYGLPMQIVERKPARKSLNDLPVHETATGSQAELVLA